MNVNITDVGFGISQILPIIIQSFLSKNNMILIEQPNTYSSENAIRAGQSLCQSN